MTQKIQMYPTDVKQPNRNKSSGLKGKCFKAVTRSGNTYQVNCRDQKDPKYHHEWSNAEEILKGKTIQCGRKSTKMCSHATYFGIKGYRNTCPIAGVTGTYTQPATLRLLFDLKQKGISPSAKIEKVELAFEHRCTGVDVANGKEYTSWGPNFNGFKVYPHRKPLTVKIGSQEQISEVNPPLSSKFGNTGKFVFKDVDYVDLTKNGVDIIYGNNLETNPGNIYIRDLKVNIYYTDGSPYIEGTQSTKEIYINSQEVCRSEIKFTIEAGYEQGTTKMSLSDSPKNLRDNIIVSTPDNVKVIQEKNDPKNQKRKIYTIRDDSLKEGDKKITFKIKGTNKKVSFHYKAKLRKKPSISMISKIERNTKSNHSVVAKNGCAKQINVYIDRIGDSPFFTFTNLDINNKENIIPVDKARDFYIKLAKLPCNTYKLFFKRDNESNKEVVTKTIEVIPTQFNFKITNLEGKEIKSYKGIQEKTNNEKLILSYTTEKELINPPSFNIINPTHGKEDSVTNKPINQIFGQTTWITQGPNDTKEFFVGKYYPGDYKIEIKENNECSDEPFAFNVKINPALHKQYYDEIFVRGEDSTAFDYEYLVAFEGDSLTEPLYVNTIELGASYKDIKVCASKDNVSGLTQVNSIDLTITNTSNKTIQNLLLELNPLVKDEDNILQATTHEWLESDGVFYNFKENFDKFNNKYLDLVSIKNLTNDNDEIDEEDVFIHIQTINPQEEITLSIPYGSSIEKEIFLEILLFGQPINLYEKGYCSDEKRVFDKISITVCDSILTSMDIIGETNLFETEAETCPQECFKTDIEYLIKNIDTSETFPNSKTLIVNDPRLIPYKFKYKGVEYNIDTYEENNTIRSKIFFDRGESIKKYPIRGARIDAYIKFKNHEEEHLHQYTDKDGETTFFVTIPRTVGGTFTIKDLLKYMSIEFSGDNFYNGKRYSIGNSEYNISISEGNGDMELSPLLPGEYKVTLKKADNYEEIDSGTLFIRQNDLDNITPNHGTYISFNNPLYSDNPVISINDIDDGDYIITVYDYMYPDSERFFTSFASKSFVSFDIFENQIEYSAGQPIPLKIKLEGENKYIKNEVMFVPDINTSGKEDSLIISYKICNLNKNEGILDTTFKTDSYRLVQNKISKKIYCGVDTNTKLKTKLSKVIVENKSLNRLYLSLINKERDNKDVRVIIKELTPEEKYDINNYEVDKGVIIKENDLIIWKIDYIEENTIIKGYIDFKAENIGQSKIKVNIKDFIDDIKPCPKFGEDSYKCECRKEGL